MEAFRWAAGAAQLRTGQELVEAPDLGVGLLLAHEDENHLKELIDHFAIGVGELFQEWYSHAFSAEQLGRAADEGRSEGLPELSPEVELILDASYDYLTQTDQAEVFLKAVTVALVTTDNVVRHRVEALMTARGVDVSILMTLLPPMLGDEKPLGELLRRDLPWAPRPFPIPSYQPDEPIPRRVSAGVDRDAPHDLLGIGSLARAFAYLLTSVQLRPPLAVGVFGHWGSGKSFFLRALQREIDRLTSNPELEGRPQRELPVFKRVVQVEFNAWQYVDGDLWSSLVEHIFRNLRFGSDRGESMLEDHQKQLIAQIEKSVLDRTAAREQVVRVQAEMGTIQRDVEAKRLKRDHELRQLESKLRADPLVSQPVLKEIQERAVEALPAELRDVGTGIGELRAAIDQGRSTYLRARQWAGLLGERSTKWWLTLLGLVIVPPAVSWALSQIVTLPSVTSVVGGLTALLGSLAAIARRTTDAVDQKLNALDRARVNLESEVEAARQQADAGILESEHRLATAADELTAAQAQALEIAQSLATLDRELKDLTPTSFLNDFLEERTGSQDYRQRLGVTALIRRDFEELSRLITLRNDGLINGTAEETDGINRIVLYIDDLDRCPNHIVVQVLQAVHLLLAFPLFVVVVAVDPRWLSEALTSHYEGLTRAQDEEHASASDYLEKIFQVPLHVRSLDPDDRRGLLRGLLENTVTGAIARSATEETQSDQSITIDTNRVTLVQSLFEKDQEDQIQQLVEALTLTRDELTHIETLAPLLGDTPRAIKRFTNIYQLLKVLEKEKNPGAAAAADPATFRRLAFMLAISNGLPTLAEAINERLITSQGSATLLDEVEKLRSDYPSGVALIADWLTENPDDNMKLGVIRPIAEAVSRFSFQLPG